MCDRVHDGIVEEEEVLQGQGRSALEAGKDPSSCRRDSQGTAVLFVGIEEGLVDSGAVVV